MEVFRLTNSKWANNLSGSGEPARWNSKDIFMVYSAESRALACLENRVRMKYALKDFSLVTIEVPNNIKVEELLIEKLPDGWDDQGLKGYAICQEYGNSWIEEGKTVLLKVPSAIIHEEYNYLINPYHRDFNKLSISFIQSFTFDIRLFN